ncbi:SPW repeat protein [Ramlibacter sp.]|uniref:SPW repeat protein n=1 Tax=Ramlibacter sp. TaxID=1917967 RepID=UPI002C580235|nr:SPW repeat protein [Ramlibacter sp.]HWI82262.1 SPW repeat protein [Ramlibacter sp.]
MKQVKHWQDPVNAVLGAWLMLSPWALGFAGDRLAMWNFLIVGVLLLAAALGAIFLPRAWEEWTESVLGLWMVVSPWVVGYAAIEAAKTDAILSGLVILTLALWALQDEGGWLARDTTAP